jgi:broad specificity phosphatase PhoE/predicted kinase
MARSTTETLPFEFGSSSSAVASNSEDASKPHLDNQLDTKLLLVLVGLPARGKSYIANKVNSYFNWRGIRSDIFNVGKFRRKTMADTLGASACFFSGSNSDGKNKREELAMAVLNDALQWMCQDNEPCIAVFDATNTTKDRRKGVVERCKQTPNKTTVIFVESICDSEEVLQDNLLQKVRHSADYKHMSEEEALADLRKRISNYEAVYEPLEDETQSYIKLINLSAKVICNQVHGSLAHQLVTLLMSTHITPRPIWLTRPGSFQKAKTTMVDTMRTKDINPKLSSLPQLSRGVSNAASLDTAGHAYAAKIAEFISERAGGRDVHVHTSTLQRSSATVSPFLERHGPQRSAPVEWSALNNLDTGICHGMTSGQVQELMPEEFAAFQRAPFRYRVPGGESYADLVKRLAPFVLHMERTTAPMLIVSHMSVLQILRGYMMNKSWEEIPETPFPAGALVQYTPNQYGWKEEVFELTNTGGDGWGGAARDYRESALSPRPSAGDQKRAKTASWG